MTASEKHCCAHCRLVSQLHVDALFSLSYRTLSDAHVSAAKRSTRLTDLGRAVQRMATDGLNSLSPDVLERARLPLYTLLKVRLCERPRRMYRCT